VNPIRFLTPVFALLFAAFASAQEPIRFARTPDISPDGKQVVFSYLGDIWTVEAIGGVARPITMHQAHEMNPLFSPDGRSIAFSSNRHGQYDVFVSPSYGGKPRRLTFDSAHDQVVSWTPDGKNIVFLSTRGTSFPGGPELYSIAVEGGQEKRLPYQEAKDLALSPTGNAVAFVRGPGTWYRKNYRGSSNDDIFLANVDGSNVRRLTDFPGQDTAPMFSPDGKKVFYVTELHGGPANIVSLDLTPSVPPAATGSPKPLTTHKEDSVRKAHISGNGEWIVYECGGDLWVTSTRDGNARKLAIEVHADEKMNTEQSVTYSRDVTEYALSPDENSLAIVVHGEVFTMPTRGGKANRVTDTPAVEHGVAWSPDGKKLIFVSDRTGYDKLHIVESDDPDTMDLTKAIRFKTKVLTTGIEAEAGATFVPDGSRIAFIREGKMWTMKPDGTDLKVLVDKQQVFDYDWSPDGKWIVYSLADGSAATELYVMPLDGSKPAVNVTRYATVNVDVTWAGGKLAFLSQRRGAAAVHVISLQKPGTGSATTPAAGDIDWDDIHLRTDRIGPPASHAYISKNGKQVAFRGGSGADDLWIASTDGGSLSRMTTGNMAPSNIRWTKGGSVYFLDNTRSLRSVTPGFGSLGLGTPPPPATISFTAKMTVRQDEEYLEMFDQGWRLLSDSFYDSKHHGSDWKMIREKYRALVKHVTMKEDLYNLVSLMLGELNASHLGIYGSIRFPDEYTADLGLLFDETYKGPGLKIAEILKRGPADKRGLGLKAGDVILAIDRTELSDKTNLSKLLNAKVNETVLLDVSSNLADPKSRRKVETQAVARDRISNLMYDRWVDQNAAAVAKQTGGKVGYIHIRGMDDAGVEQFTRALYSDNFDKEGIVIDVRHNGGGFTHDQVLNYLGAKEHTFFRQRDGGEGLVMRQYDRKWTKPSTLLINNRSYSDAEIFPAAYRALGLGKVVGQATGGMVIGTNETRLIDGSTFRLPLMGVYTARGVNMEKEGVQPDVAVDALPEDLAKGNDAQLKRAVEVLTVEVAEWKKAKSAGLATKPTPPASGTPVSTPPMPPMGSPMVPK
jgi:tricorn protease